MTKPSVLQRLRSTEHDVICPCLDLRKAAADEIERLLTPSKSFEEWWAANPEPWNDAKTLAMLAWNASRHELAECKERLRQIDDWPGSAHLRSADEPTAPKDGG